MADQKEALELLRKQLPQAAAELAELNALRIDSLELLKWSIGGARTCALKVADPQPLNLWAAVFEQSAQSWEGRADDAALNTAWRQIWEHVDRMATTMSTLDHESELFMQTFFLILTSGLLGAAERACRHSHGRLAGTV